MQSVMLPYIYRFVSNVSRRFFAENTRSGSQMSCIYFLFGDPAREKLSRLAIAVGFLSGVTGTKDENENIQFSNLANRSEI